MLVASQKIRTSDVPGCASWACILRMDTRLAPRGGIWVATTVVVLMNHVDVSDTVQGTDWGRMSNLTGGTCARDAANSLRRVGEDPVTKCSDSSRDQSDTCSRLVV